MSRKIWPVYLVGAVFSYAKMAHMILYAACIFVSAFLLFLIQPIIAKQILPWFGGSAAVWTTCLVFFQCALLAGYFYSDWTSRKLATNRQVILHIGLILLALLLLPITPDDTWRPTSSEQPSLHILLMLGVTIGLPYCLLAATSPLVQVWFARSYPNASPYRLFALSNFASMLALLGYPLILEPAISARAQAIGWSAGFLVFAILIITSAWRSRTSVSWPAPSGSNTDTFDGPASIVSIAMPPSGREKALWILLSALASVFLLAISNHLTRNISSIPLLWVVPLSIYLITFILCFDSKRGQSNWYRREIFVPLLVCALLLMSWTLANNELHFLLYWQIGLFLSGLFVACMFCHGELADRKPHAAHLTTYYLMISVGGALGAALVGLVAPLVLSAYFELEIAIVLLATLTVGLVFNRMHAGFGVACVLTMAFVVFATTYSVLQYRKDALVMTRNFYGTLRVKEFNPPEVEIRRRKLIDGAIMHGDQYPDPPHNRLATTYYLNSSGVGRILILKEKLHPDIPRKVGIIGLGTGTIAVFGNKGDTFRFYDINPAVVEIAQRDFTYLRDTAADVEIALGDARLNLEREMPQAFDVLAVDAFSSDSIPAHLMTLEALDIYTKHLKPDGVIAFHVSNRFLDLRPVVRAIAERRGLHAVWLQNRHSNETVISDWVLVARSKDQLQRPEILEATLDIPPTPGFHAWTDDFNNLLGIIK